ncbi:uncharacterized protein TEOVI_000783400 [Trypanosoma equiperdum]|uniref:Uncharacterized protein n=1 Tax=Trypanosoma equiperdum TaxID=5694 RepID=A0A1G4I256_TRYEQ|nr:hypothetical protein, conserved [Trypanosoma equiperdum]
MLLSQTLFTDSTLKQPRDALAPTVTQRAKDSGCCGARAEKQAGICSGCNSRDFTCSSRSSRRSCSGVRRRHTRKNTTACQEAAFAETVAGIYEQIANQQQHAVQDLRDQAANWRLTAAAEPDQQSAHLLSALPAYAEAQSAKARSAIKLTTQELSAAAKAYHARAHFLYGAQEQAAVTWNTETNGYKKVSGTTFKARTGAPKPGTSKCDDNSRKIGSTIPTTTAFGTNNLKKIAYSTPEQIAKLTPRTVLTITAGATCSTDDTNSWGATVACCNGITATPTYDHEQEAATGPTAV